MCCHALSDKSHYLIAPLEPAMQKKYIFYECSCKKFKRNFACWHAPLFR